MVSCSIHAPAPCHSTKPLRMVMVASLFATAACQTTPMTPSGYLSTYANLPKHAKKPSLQHRHDIRSDAIQSIYITPAELIPGLKTKLSDKERRMVLHELDRQICFEVSERFKIVKERAPDAGIIRTIVVQLRSNSRAGSIAAVAADRFNPIPVVNFRLPGTGGGMAVESELLDPRGEQVAAILWQRKVGVIGQINPSLSRAGDALQIAEPLGDAVGKAVATKKRPKIKIGKNDPCAHIGSRNNIKRSLANTAVGGLTGLYIPQVAGTSLPEDESAPD